MKWILLLLLISCASEVADLPDRELPDRELPDRNLPDRELPNLQTEPSVGESITLTNPTSGVDIEAMFFDAGSDHTVILVQGGAGHMASFQTGKGPNPSMVDRVTDAGYNALIFNPDGRGKSGGVEDYNGHIGQDALYAVYEYAESKGSVGIASFSYGVALASGMLGRYDVSPEYYIEWEGPVDRYYVTVNCTGGAVREDVTCDDDEYWSQREAITYVKDWNIDTFIVVQGMKDHVQPSWQHTIDMNNEAIKYVDYVQMNSNTPNIEHTEDTMVPINNIEKENFVIEKISELL